MRSYLDHLDTCPDMLRAIKETIIANIENTIPALDWVRSSAARSSTGRAIGASRSSGRARAAAAANSTRPGRGSSHA